MHIVITAVLSPVAIPMRNSQARGYRVTFTSDVVAGQALFVPANKPTTPVLGQQYFVETDYEGSENMHIWRPPDQPTLQMTPRVPSGDYDLIATVAAVTPLTDANNLLLVDVVIGASTFALTVPASNRIMPRVGDVIACTVQSLSLWDTAL